MMRLGSPPTAREQLAGGGESRDIECQPPSLPGTVLRFLFVRVPELITGTLFLVAVTINIANVVGRYVFSAPLFWAEEVLVFMVVWGVFVAAIAITFNRAHLAMDLFHAKLERPWKQIVNGAIAATFLVCCGFAAVQSFRVVALYVRNQGVSTAAEIPLFIPHAALLVGFSLMTLAVLIRIKAYVGGTSG
jgi:TRAP-type C4-dicarboxylate transport system permease small subunit